MLYFRARFPARGIIVLAMNRTIGIIAILTACLLTGCSKGANFMPDRVPSSEDSTSSWEEYSAIVTVKKDAAGAIFFQLDDDTRLYPQNYTDPFTRQCRIICGFLWQRGNNRCTLKWMDYLQEGVVTSVSAPEGDGVDVLNDWMTSVEDGYLTLHYSTLWGDGRVQHTLQLVTGDNPSDPYEVRLVHLNNGDTALEEGDALIYFDLASLPATGSEGRALTLKWKNGAGQMVSKSFLFRSRQ